MMGVAPETETWKPKSSDDLRAGYRARISPQKGDANIDPNILSLFSRDPQ